VKEGESYLADLKIWVGFLESSLVPEHAEMLRIVQRHRRLLQGHQHIANLLVKEFPVSRRIDFTVCVKQLLEAVYEFDEMFSSHQRFLDTLKSTLDDQTTEVSHICHCVLMFQPLLFILDESRLDTYTSAAESLVQTLGPAKSGVVEMILKFRRPKAISQLRHFHETHGTSASSKTSELGWDQTVPPCVEEIILKKPAKLQQ